MSPTQKKSTLGEPRLWGCHVSVSGGLARALENARILGVNTIQIHASPPQRWNAKPAGLGVEDEFMLARETSAVKKLFFHGIYLINLASLDPQIFHLSKVSLQNSLDLIARMNGDGVIFHIGTFRDHEDEEVGFRQIADGVNWALDKTPANARLILEVAAGSGKVVGARLEQLARVYELVAEQNRVGFALDTQHLWASGYNLQEDLDGFIERAGAELGLEKIWAIHLNDSKTECGSKRDRHENIGEGLIGEAALRRFFFHPHLKSIPFILETPAMKDLSSAADEVTKITSWLDRPG